MKKEIINGQLVSALKEGKTVVLELYYKDFYEYIDIRKIDEDNGKKTIRVSSDLYERGGLWFGVNIEYEDSQWVDWDSNDSSDWWFDFETDSYDLSFNLWDGTVLYSAQDPRFELRGYDWTVKDF